MRHLAQARNPYSLSWLWIPGSRQEARPGMTTVIQPYVTPPPLSIGTLRLADGRGVKGFIVEAAEINGARDISAFGGWRAFMAEAIAPAK